MVHFHWCIWPTTDLEGAPCEKPGLLSQTLQINSIRTLVTDVQDDPPKFSSGTPSNVC